jgi:hypothetical protein
MSVERQLLYEQLRILREVNETVKPAGYWREFIDRLIPQLGYLGPEIGLPHADADPDAVRALVVGYVAAAYPGARQYLMKEWNLPVQQLEQYPVTQVVFLAMVRFYDQWRDEFFKWMYLPVWQTEVGSSESRVDQKMLAAAKEYGWCSAPTMILLPAIRAVRTAQARADQHLAMIQTVEAIRMYAAENNGKLPNRLSDLPVPAPVEPLTGRELEYQCHGSRATLTGAPLPGRSYRLILRFANAAD